MPESLDKSSKIREQNDLFRSTFIGGKVVITPDVMALAPSIREELITAVRTKATFPEGDDPYKEHDFGMFTVQGERYYWKIDYYDRELEYGSEDPSDPTKTARVLTIMSSSEY